MSKSVGGQIGVERVGTRTKMLNRALSKSSLTDSQKQVDRDKFSELKLSVSKGKTKSVMASAILKMGHIDDLKLYSSLLTSDKIPAPNSLLLSELRASLVGKKKCSKSEFTQFVGDLRDGSNLESVKSFLSKLDIETKQLVFSKLVPKEVINEMGDSELACLLSGKTKPEHLNPVGYLSGRRV